ncbi:hypothetical protein V8D89_000935 [Ganoderma adspersum]
MPLVDRGWSLSDGNVVGTVTYTYDSPWTTYTYAHTFSSQVVTLPSDAMAQAQTQTDTTCTTTTSTSTRAGTATRTPTQSPTLATASRPTDALTTSPTPYPTSLADESPSASRSASERGSSRSSGASFGVVSPSPALTQALAGSSSAGQPIPSGPSRNLNSASPGRGMGKGAIASIALAVVLALGLGLALCWMWRRRGGRRRESSFIQYPFLWRSDAASAASMSEVPSRALTPPRTPVPAEWDTFGDRDAEVAESARTTAATMGSHSPAGASGYGGGLEPALGEKSQLPPVATGPSLRFSAAFPMPSPVSLSPTTTVPATSPSTPLALAPPPAVHDADLLPSPASTLPYGYAWDHPPPPPGGRRPSYGTVSVSYSTAMADSEVGSRPPSYSRY